jgi:hypothetical protein
VLGATHGRTGTSADITQDMPHQRDSIKGMSQNSSGECFEIDEESLLISLADENEVIEIVHAPSACEEGTRSTSRRRVFRSNIESGSHHGNATSIPQKIAGDSPSLYHVVGYSKVGNWEAVTVLDKVRATKMVAAAVSSMESSSGHERPSDPPSLQQRPGSSASQVGPAAQSVGGGDDSSVGTGLSVTHRRLPSDQSAAGSVPFAASDNTLQQPFRLRRVASHNVATGAALSSGVSGAAPPADLKGSGDSRDGFLDTNPSAAVESPKYPLAQLVLRRFDRATGNRNRLVGESNTVPQVGTQPAEDVGAIQEVYRIDLSFRPLAPTLIYDSQFASESALITDEPESRPLGVVVGSADDSSLYFFQLANNLSDVPMPSEPTSTDASGCSLVPVKLDHPAFQFRTSIMALAYDPARQGVGIDADSDEHCLAVGCQDGTVRLILFHIRSGESGGAPFVVVDETTMVVDGPIMCIDILHLQPDSTGFADTPTPGRRMRGGHQQYRRHVVFGCLPGYVAEMYQTFASFEPESMPDAEQPARWDGPFMVAEGFRNQRINMEDSVLAVHLMNTCCTLSSTRVCIGAYSGRCLLYERRAPGQYEWLWECQLPYSIHGIDSIPRPLSWSRQAKDHDILEANPIVPTSAVLGPPLLVLTTSRSIHLFQSEQDEPTTTGTEMTERISRMLNWLRQQQNESRRAGATGLTTIQRVASQSSQLSEENDLGDYYY